MANILDEYLVKLGATVDTGSFNKFESTLKNADKLVAGFSLKSVANFAKLDAAIVGAFASFGAGVIALADKTAMADQQYRLIGLRMLMGRDAARAMTMATEDLGASLDEIAFDPELNRRFQALTAQYEKMGKTLGSGFDKSMLGIRDLRMEVKIFQRELEFLTMGAVSHLFDKLGFGSGDALNKLNQLNDWFVSNLPHWSDEIATDLVPLWNDFKVVIGDAGSIAKAVAGDFAFLSGLLLGDKSIESTEFNVRNLVEALQDWADALTKVEIAIGVPFRTALHGMNAVLGTMSSEYWVPGKDRDKFRAKTDAEADAFVHDLHGMLDPDRYATGQDFAAYQQFRNRSDVRAQEQAQEASAGSGNYSDLIRAAAQKYGIDPNFIAAVIQTESGGMIGAKSKAGAMGLMQLMPGTAAQYGVTNAFNPQQNIDAGTHLLSDLNKKYGGDASKVLAAYNWGSGNFDRYGRGGENLPEETRTYISRVAREYSSLQAGGTGSVTINGLTINVPHTASTPSEIQQYITGSMRDLINQRTATSVAAGAGAYQ